MKRLCLMEEQSIAFYPSLAKIVGVNCAIILQQAYFLLNLPRGGKVIGGEKWIYNTYEEWQRDHFPFWSIRTIERSFSKLEEIGFLISCQPEGAESRRKYYRLNRGMIQNLTIEAASEIDIEQSVKVTGSWRQSDGMDGVKVTDSLSTETTTDNCEHSPDHFHYCECESPQAVLPAQAGSGTPPSSAIPPLSAFERLADRARRWFNRKDTTSFDQAEIRAIRSAAKLNIPDDDLALLDRWFALPDRECFEKYGNGRKRTISSLFNAINGEIEKARNAFKSKPQQTKATQPKINPEAYLLWLDKQDYGDRMKPEWRDINTAPQTLLDAFLENNK